MRIVVNFKDTPDKMQEKLGRYIQDTIYKVLKENKHYATGDLYHSFEPEDVTVARTTNSIEIKMTYKLPDPAGIVLHTGSRPHCPPIKPLEKWAMAKLGLGDPGEARRIAWAVRQTICEKGNKAYKWLNDLVEELRESRVEVDGRVKHD